MYVYTYYVFIQKCFPKLRVRVRVTRRGHFVATMSSGLMSSVANIAVKLAFWRYQIVYIGRQIDVFILALLVTFRGITGPFVW